MTTEIATLGGGSFWCLEAVFEQLKGIKSVQSGYAGGHALNPGYEQVATGTTGHAEVVQIEFDPEVIQYQDILKIFFTIHDPTTLNREGNDVGCQHRSIVFYHSDAQKEIVERVMEMLTNEWTHSFETEVRPAMHFYLAEDNHQDFYLNNQNDTYCSCVIDPKVTKLRKMFFEFLKNPV